MESIIQGLGFRVSGLRLKRQFNASVLSSAAEPFDMHSTKA